MTFIIGTPHTKNAGHLIAQSGGYRSVTEECDIRTCTHCQKVLKMNLWKEDGGWCSKCNAPICGPCADNMLLRGCEPWTKQIDQAFDQAVKLDQFRKLAGLDQPPANYVPKLIVSSGA